MASRNTIVKERHVCNTDNQYYRYAVKKGYSLIAVIPKGHCVFCGDERT